MKKIFVLFLCAVMVVGSLVSCTVTKTTVDGEIEYKDEVPEKIEKPNITSAMELYKKSSESRLGLESMSTNIKGVFDMTAMGESERLDFDISVDANLKDMLYHMVSKMTSSGSMETTENEMYYTLGATYAKDVVDGLWYKHSEDIDDVAQFRDYMNSLKNMNVDMSKYISDASFEACEYNGKECYKLNYTFDIRLLDILGEFVEAEEMAELKESLAEELGPEMATVIYDMLNDLGAVPVVEYIDAYTLLCEGAEVEMTETLNALFNKIVDVVISMYGEGMSAEDLGLTFAVNELRMSVTYGGYNETDVVIPEDVLAAPEFYEDYTEDLYEDYYDDYYEDYDDYEELYEDDFFFGDAA